MKEWGFRAPFPHRPSRTRRRTHHYLPLSKPFFDFPRLCIQQSTEAASQSAYFSSAASFTRVGVGWPRPAGRRGPGAQGHVLVTRPGSPAALFREALIPQGLAGSPAAGAAAARGDRSFQKGKRLHQRGNPYFFHCSFITRLSACSTSQKQLTVTVPK